MGLEETTPNQGRENVEALTRTLDVGLYEWNE